LGAKKTRKEPSLKTTPLSLLVHSMVNIVSFAVGVVAAMAAAVVAQDPSAAVSPPATSSSSVPTGSSAPSSSAKYALSNAGGKVLSGSVNGTKQSFYPLYHENL
jgi:hypothetical protein